MPLLLLLFLVAGCASPGRELHRGSAVAPPPPPLRPGHGAPVVGQPGQRAPELPRSPHRRPLPPTAEPGLWAGDGPQAAKGTPSKPEILGVPLPGLPTDTGEPDHAASRVCVALWDVALPGTGLVEKARRLEPGAKRCLVGRVFQACSRIVEGLDDNLRKHDVLMLWARQNRERFKKGADAFAQEACKEAPLTPGQGRLLEEIVRALRTGIPRT